MKKQLIANIYEILRSVLSFHRDTQNQLFVLQILAWMKLSQSEKCPNELSFDRISDQVEVITTKQLSDIFERLTKLSKIGENAKAFQVERKCIEKIGPTVLERLISFLRSAYITQIINYRESVWEIQEFFFKDGEGLTGVPFEVAKLAVDLAAVSSKDRVYCPFEYSYTPALLCCDHTDDVYTETQLMTPYPYIINILCETSLQPKFSDPINSPSWICNGKLQQFDISIAFPPFGIRYGEKPVDMFDRFYGKTLYGEVFHIQHVIAQIQKRAVIAVPHSVLFRTSAGEKALKQDLIKQGFLEAVIALPPGLLRTTALPFALVLINKEIPEALSHTILFINVSSEEFFTKRKGRNILKNTDKIVSLFHNPSSGPYSQIVSAQECMANNFNLLPDRYVLSPEQRELQEYLHKKNTIELADIATLIRPQSIRSQDEENDTDFFEVMVSDIPPNGYIKTPERTVTIDINKIQRAEQQRLQPLDILISTKGTIGAVGIVPPDFKGKWIAGQSFQIIRLKDTKHIIDQRILYMYLKSKVCNELLKSKASGATVQMVQTRDIKTLPVVILSAEEQQKVFQSFNDEIEIQQKINELHQELEKISKKNRELLWGAS